MRSKEILLNELKDQTYLVTDTSWWLEQGRNVADKMAKKYNKLFFIIPAGVMKELDGLKKNKEKKDLAHKSIKQIMLLIYTGKAEVTLNEGKYYYNVLSSRVDEEVVKVAENLKNEGKKVFLLTIDNAQMILAKQVGIKAYKAVYFGHLELFICAIFVISLLLCIYDVAIGSMVLLFGMIAGILKVINPKYKIFQESPFELSINNINNVYFHPIHSSSPGNIYNFDD